jgi:hypothetical protein
MQATDHIFHLSQVLKALLSTGDVTLTEVDVFSPGVKQRGFRLTVSSSVVLDGEHARAVRDDCGIAIVDDASPVPQSALDCTCRETMQEYILTPGCPVHDNQEGM